MAKPGKSRRAGENARGLAGHHLGFDQQHRIPVSALSHFSKRNANYEPSAQIQSSVASCGFPVHDLSMPLSRREVMRVGLFGAAGLLFGGGQVFGGRYGAVAQPRAPAQPPGKIKAKSVIQIFLWGGMSHNDTWDPKPDAGYDYMGDSTKPSPTNVDGIQIGEWFPNLAKQADKYSLIRSMTHRNNGHETAAYLMQTGARARRTAGLSRASAPCSRCSRARNTKA